MGTGLGGVPKEGWGGSGGIDAPLGRDGKRGKRKIASSSWPALIILQEERKRRGP